MENDWYNTPHYAVVMKYAKIEIEDKLWDKTLFVQTEAREDEKKGREEKPVRPRLVRGSVSAPRQREFVQLSKLTAIFNGTNCRDSSVLRDPEEFSTYSLTYLRYFSELCIILQRRLK